MKNLFLFAYLVPIWAVRIIFWLPLSTFYLIKRRIDPDVRKRHTVITIAGWTLVALAGLCPFIVTPEGVDVSIALTILFSYIPGAASIGGLYGDHNLLSPQKPA